MHRAKRLAFSDLPSSIQMNFNTYNIPVYTMQAADPAQIRNYFKVLQNQEKLRAGEIINALPDNPMSTYFDRIPAEAFLARTGCSSFKRAELEKVYYSVLGAWFDKIQLNASDKTVISFVENMPDLTETQIAHINNLNSGIIAISQLPGAVQKIRSSKRMLKLVFGLALHAPGYFSTTDAFSRLQAVCELSSKLAAFNTSDLTKWLSRNISRRIHPRQRELRDAEGMRVPSLVLEHISRILPHRIRRRNRDSTTHVHRIVRLRFRILHRAQHSQIKGT